MGVFLRYLTTIIRDKESRASWPPAVSMACNRSHLFTDEMARRLQLPDELQLSSIKLFCYNGATNSVVETTKFSETSFFVVVFLMHIYITYVYDAYSSDRSSMSYDVKEVDVIIIT